MRNRKTHNAVPRCIRLDGCGWAGQAVVDALIDQATVSGSRPVVTLVDCGVWRSAHVGSGLVDAREINRSKTDTTRERLLRAGWPEGDVRAKRGDVRDEPRGAYERCLTVACTDSHAIKDLSVTRACQVGGAAVPIGLSPTEAIVETFHPGGSGYCCIHRADPDWCRRQPCLLARPTSTTAFLGDQRGAASAAGRLVVDLAADLFATGGFPADQGARVTAASAEWFSYDRDPRQCPGPHDAPLTAEGVRHVAIPPDGLRLDVFLGLVCPVGRYADRLLSWVWDCETCQQSSQRLHTRHPPLHCPACGAAMQAGFERASDLTLTELQMLIGSSRMPTLTDMGLGTETIIRCTTAEGRVQWARLEENGHDAA